MQDMKANWQLLSLCTEIVKITHLLLKKGGLHLLLAYLIAIAPLSRKSIKNVTKKQYLQRRRSSGAKQFV